MRSPLELRSTLSALGVVALLVACLSMINAFSERAVADPTIGLPRPGLAVNDGPLVTRNKLAVRFASHHEEEEEEEEEEDDDFNLEDELADIELERAYLESFFGGLELVEKVAKLAADDDGIVALAITSTEDIMEQEDRVELLTRVAAEAPRKSARRLARLQLAEIYGEEDNTSAARAQLEALIFEK